jgi:hypothetical protein
VKSMYNAELKIIVIFDAQIIEAVLYHINCGVMCHFQFASIIYTSIKTSTSQSTWSNG